ncbi:beta-defensin 12-like [Ochotona curzoniae]|uniref:beta-defensin 12-like n=1 Tax=Ochotona curzoniae TaxID=130825 RepID=UPI001B345AAA|nr:beta-defensin 12-like [Ochotona curzoniae]
MTFYFAFAFFFILAFSSEGQAELDYSQSFPAGEFAVCEPCWLGRGKCRKACLEKEQIAGSCKLNYFCCRPKR